MQRTVERIVILVILTLVATPASAERWRRGKPPSGVTVIKTRTATDGTVCYYTSETGTNECRWKTNWGCKWTADSGSNQCTPGADKTPTAGVTLTATNGSITVQPVVDGDANPETYAAVLTMRKASTGEVVTGKIRVRIPTADPTAMTVLSDAVTGLQTTPLTVIPGTSTYRPISRTAGGWQLGGAPTPTPPPGGQTCAVAWNNYVSGQFNCFNDVWGQAIRQSMVNGLTVGWGAAVGCGINAGGSMANFLTCEAKAVGGGFVYGFVNTVFRGPDPQAGWCNGAAYSRYLMSQYCEPRFP